MTAGIYLVSACGSAEEFVAAFRRYADRTGLFIPLASPLPQGKKGRIALTLKDGGVMLEGEAEVVQSSTKSPLHGRAGVVLKFTDLDEPSKTVLGELEKARLAMKPAPPSVPPRPADVPAEPRPVVPAVGGRIDAANALAECVAIGDVTALEDAAGGPLKAGPKFVVPSIPAIGGRPKTPTAPPEAAAKTDATVGKLTTMGMPAMRAPADVAATPRKDPTPVPARKDPTPVPARKDPTPIPAASKSGGVPPAPLPSAKSGGVPAAAASPTNVGPPPVSASASSSKSGPVAASSASTASKSGPVAAPAADATTNIGPAPAVPIATAGSQSGRVAAPSASTASKSGPVAAGPNAASRSGGIPPAPKTDPMPTVAPKRDTAAFDAEWDQAAPPAPPAPPAAKADAKKAAKMTQLGFPVVKPPADSGPKTGSGPQATPLGVVPLRATDAPSGSASKPTASSVPAPPKLPESTPATAGKPPLPQPTPTRSKSPTAPPRNPTPFAPLPVAKLPAKPAPMLADTDADEKTDLTNVPLEPDAGEALIESKPPADIEPPKRSGGMRASEIMAAVHSDDWTMTPDAPAPTVLPVEKPRSMMPEVPEPTPGPGAPPTGDWTMSLDPAEGWSPPEKLKTPPGPAEKPTKIEKRTPVVQTPATGNPVKAVSSDKPIDVQAWEDKPTSIGAKIEIDSTLMGDPLDQDSLAEPPLPDDEPMIGPAGSAPGMHVGVPHASGSLPGAAMHDNGAQPMSAFTPQGMEPLAPPYDAPPAHVPNATGPELAVAQSLLQPPPAPLPPPPPAGMGMPQEIPIAYAPTLLPGQMTAPPLPPPLQYATAQPGDLYRGDAQPMLPPPANKKRIVIVASVVGVVVLAVVLALALGGKHKPAQAKQSKGSAAAVVLAGSGSAEGSQTPAVVVPPTHDTQDTHGSSEGSATQEVATPAKPETCPVEVATTPSGAEVSFDDKMLGTTPGTFQLPCGTVAKLKIQKPKYLGVVRQVTPTAAGTKLAVTLGQGMFSVKITSTPMGATIRVAGSSKGVTPTAVQLPAFQTVTITVSKEGYATDTEKLVVKANGQIHHVTLRRAGRSKSSSQVSHGLNGI